jgi:hypothetical protein
MAVKYKSKISVKPYDVALAQPLDVRTVVESVDDLKSALFIDSKAYNGMVVFVDDEEDVNNRSLYVCYNKPEEIEEDLTNVEDVWRKLDVDYSVRIVENVDELLTIMFPYQGMMAYVNSESSLYILMTKGASKAKEIGNWRKISHSSSKPTIDKVGIDVAPEGGSGFKITGNKGVIIDDYINVENYIKAGYAYTSKGVNSFEPDLNFTYDTVRLSKGGNSYIELYANSDNWMSINDPDNSLGLSATIDGVDYVSGTPIAKETLVCFGADIKFHEGWIISYGQISRPFVDVDYELIDIYRSEYSPEVYAYRKDIDVRILTEDDLVVIDDKIDNLAHSIMIELGENGESDSDSDVLETVTLQEVIVNMNNSIAKLEQTKVKPETIEQSEIDELFS